MIAAEEPGEDPEEAADAVDEAADVSREETESTEISETHPGSGDQAISAELSEETIEEDDISESDRLIGVDTAGDTTWQEDYEYCFDARYIGDETKDAIILNGDYKGNAQELLIPAKAVIDGKEYITVIIDCRINNTEVKSVRFEKGVIVESMYMMFLNCSAITSIDLSGIDTTELHSMDYTFKGCSSLKSVDFSGFDTSNVTGMYDMFSGCSSLTTVDLSGFDTSNVTGMSGMFDGCSSLTTVDVSGFDTSKVTDMGHMFYGCSNLSSVDVSGFNTSNVTGLYSMFEKCSSLTTVDVSGFDTSNVTSMYCMFRGCTNLKSVDVSKFNTSKVTGIYGMFDGCSRLTKLDVSGFDVSKVESNFHGLSTMFRGCSSLTELDVSRFDTSNITDMREMFRGCSSLTKLDVSGFDTSKVTDTSCMFYECSSLTSLDVSGFDTSNITDMSEMFRGCSSLKTVDVSKFDTSNVVGMNNMFYLCQSLEAVDVRGFDTSRVENMAYMFGHCKNLAELNVKNFNTTNVKRMDGMFCDCSKLSDLDVTGFDTSNVECMYVMFSNLSLKELDVSGFKTGKLKYAGYLFFGSKELKSLDLSGWDLSAVLDVNEKDPYWTDKQHIFAACESLETIKTPLNLSANIVIPLPGKYVDESGKSYTELPRSDKSITLLRTHEGTTPAPTPETGEETTPTPGTVSDDDVTPTPASGTVSGDDATPTPAPAPGNNLKDGEVYVSPEDASIFVTPAKFTKPVNVSTVYGGKEVSASLTYEYMNAVVYNGNKIIPGKDFDASVNTANILSSVSFNSGVKADQAAVFTISFKAANNKNAGRTKKATYFAKLKINKGVDKMMSKDEYKKLKKLVSAANKALKKDKCEFTINPKPVTDAAPELIAKYNKDGTLKTAKKTGLLSGAKLWLNLAKKTKVAGSSFTMETPVTAENGKTTVKVTGKKNFTGTAVVEVK